MGTKNVRFERDGAIARLTFTRPEKLNALSPALIDEALAVSEDVARSDARVLVVSGEGRAFSSGVDLAALTSDSYGPEAAMHFSDQARKLERCWELAPQVVIARVSGYCFTGGLELALACDFIIAADDALFSDTHGLLGSFSHWGLSQRLPRRIGVQRAKEMALTARRLTARQALDYGLVLDVVAKDQLDARIDEMAQAIMPVSEDSVSAYKALFLKSQNLLLDEALAFESTAPYRIADRATRRKQTLNKISSDQA